MNSVFENEQVSIEKIQIENVPCLKIRPREESGLLPTVIYYHGWSSNKDYQHLKGFILSTQGYQVIVPDAIHHGDRGILDYEDPKIADKYFYEIIIQNVEESKGLIENIIKNHNADPDKIAVMGSSMGGFSASGVFIRNPQLKCLVVFNGSCAWINSAEIFRQKAGKGSLNEEEVSSLIDYDPLKNTQLLNRRPILMFHGDSDSMVSIESQKLFYEETLPIYSENQEDFKFIEIPRLNHYITIGMFEEAILWLKKHL